MKRGNRTILLSAMLISCVLWVNAQRRPVIGISDTHRDGTNAAVPRSYVNAVLLTGGIPVVIPLMNEDDEMIALINSLDGIIFTGGEDFDPAYYNERPISQMGRVNAPRDKFDLQLLKLAAERSVPILGICRGIQLINIAFGGSLYQDLPAQYHDNSIRHRQSQSSEEASHAIIVEDYTVFADIVKDRMLMVNSSHHQAIKGVAGGFRVAGKSPDEIVEVIEKIDDQNWILGVQFHPEMRVSRDIAMRRIFQRFIEVAADQQSPDHPARTVTASRPQIEYKYIRDTLYVYIPVDTAFLSVSNTTIPDSGQSESIQTLREESTVIICDSVSDTLINTPVEEVTLITKNSDASKSKMKREEKAKLKQEKREAKEKEKQLRKEMIETKKQKKIEQKELKKKEKFEKKFAKEKEKLFISSI